MHAVPTTPVSWEAVLSSGFLQHLQYVRQGGLQGQGALRCGHLRRGPAEGALPGARGAADSRLRKAAGPAR